MSMLGYISFMIIMIMYYDDVYVYIYIHIWKYIYCGINSLYLLPLVFHICDSNYSIEY